MVPWILSGFLLVSSQDPKEAEVGALLKKLKTGSAAERESAAKRLGPWVWHPQEGADGFSDKTVDRPPEPPKLSSDLYDRVSTELAEATSDVDPAVRSAAAESLSGLYGKRPAVQAAVLKVLQAKDRTVVWSGLRAFDRVDPAAEAAVPILTELLDHEGEGVRDNAARALGKYGAKALTAVPALLRRLPLEEYPWTHLYALAAIGLDEPQAKELAAIRLAKADSSDDLRFVVLSGHPDLALAFLNERPKLFKDVTNPEGLLELVGSVDPKSEKLRKAVLDRPDLPPVVMAWSHDPRFLAAIQDRLKKANKHDATFLAACARACGAPADRVIKLSDKEPGAFRPKSALPGADESRKGEGFGIGCGSTPLLVTGRLVMADGSPVVSPRFINENDRLLMGTRTEDPGPIRYDAKTGRFTFYTSIFASYAIDGKQREPGPWETGSAQVRIEAKGAKPLVLHFYDEMPDVHITLSAPR